MKILFDILKVEEREEDFLITISNEAEIKEEDEN